MNDGVSAPTVIFDCCRLFADLGRKPPEPALLTDAVEKLCSGTPASYGLWSLCLRHAARSGSTPLAEAFRESFNSIDPSRTWNRVSRKVWSWPVAACPL